MRWVHLMIGAAAAERSRTTRRYFTLSRTEPCRSARSLGYRWNSERASFADNSPTIQNSELSFENPDSEFLIRHTVRALRTTIASVARSSTSSSRSATRLALKWRQRLVGRFDGLRGDAVEVFVWQLMCCVLTHVEVLW